MSHHPILRLDMSSEIATLINAWMLDECLFDDRRELITCKYDIIDSSGRSSNASSDDYRLNLKEIYPWVLHWEIRYHLDECFQFGATTSTNLLPGLNHLGFVWKLEISFSVILPSFGYESKPWYLLFTPSHSWVKMDVHPINKWYFHRYW